MLAATGFEAPLAMEATEAPVELDWQKVVVVVEAAGANVASQSRVEAENLAASLAHGSQTAPRVARPSGARALPANCNT